MMVVFVLACHPTSHHYPTSQYISPRQIGTRAARYARKVQGAPHQKFHFPDNSLMRSLFNLARWMVNCLIWFCFPPDLGQSRARFPVYFAVSREKGFERVASFPCGRRSLHDSFGGSAPGWEQGWPADGCRVDTTAGDPFPAMGQGELRCCWRSAGISRSRGTGLPLLAADFQAA
jgi:hypothetical protein